MPHENHSFQYDCDAILFDLDGVLVDSRHCIERLWQMWASQHHINIDKVLHYAHGRRSVETIRLVAPHLDAEREAADAVGGRSPGDGRVGKDPRRAGTAPIDPSRCLGHRHLGDARHRLHPPGLWRAAGSGCADQRRGRGRGQTRPRAVSLCGDDAGGQAGQLRGDRRRARRDPGRPRRGDARGGGAFQRLHGRTS